MVTEVTVPSRVTLVDGRKATLVGILPRNNGALEDASFGVRLDSVKHLGIAFMTYADIDFEDERPYERKPKKVVKKVIPKPTPAPKSKPKVKKVLKKKGKS